jgi:CheY-like chemotaxis protein
MPKILVVEDEASLANAYVLTLKEAGHDVILATDGQQALEACSTQQFDGILLDMLMPGVSGIEFLRQAKLSIAAPHTKVLVISNTESSKIHDEAMQLGASEYVLKVDSTPHGIADKLTALLAK